jgi:hypothetical protein
MTRQGEIFMDTAIPWNLAGIQPEDHEAEVCTRFQRLFESGQIGAQLTAVWQLDSGYTNIGVYVVGVTAPKEQTSYHLVLAYGRQYCIMRRDQPLDNLLAQSGFAVFVEFCEKVLDRVIDPTEQQIRAFAEHYPLAVERWLAASMNENFTGHPRDLSLLDILSLVFDYFDDQEQHLRAGRYFCKLWAKYIYPEKPEWIEVKTLTQEAENRLYEWWKTSACVDYHFPPPPALDHNRRRVISDFSYRDKTYKRVEVYGQVAVVPRIMPFHHPTKSGFDLVDLESHKEISSWLPTNPGGKAAACTFARQVSQLTDMKMVPTFSSRQMYGMRIRIHELLCATYALASEENKGE